MIHFDNVIKRYPGGSEGLSNINLHINHGEMVFLTGHSGAGKSTLLKLIGLLERSTSGQLIVSGRNLSRMRKRQIPYHRREVGMIFQDHKLLKDKTVAPEDLAAAARSVEDSTERMESARASWRPCLMICSWLPTIARLREMEEEELVDYVDEGENDEEENDLQQTSQGIFFSFFN